MQTYYLLKLHISKGVIVVDRSSSDRLLLVYSCLFANNKKILEFFGNKIMEEGRK